MRVGFGRRVFVALTLVGAALPAVTVPAAADPGGCVTLVQQAEGWIDSPDKYMESPRRGDFRQNEPLTVYAEVDHFEMRADQATADGEPLTETMVPVYRAFSLPGLLLQMRNEPLPPEMRQQVTPAWTAIASAWDAWANGDPTKPVPYDAAKQILVDAEGRCNTA